MDPVLTIPPAPHERYWHGSDYRGWLGRPDFTVDDTTLAVLQRFRVVARVRS